MAFFRQLWKALLFKYKTLLLVFGQGLVNLGYFYSNIWSHCSRRDALHE